MPVIMIGQAWLILPLAHASQNELGLVVPFPLQTDLNSFRSILFFLLSYTKTVPPPSLGEQALDDTHRLESRRLSFYIFSRNAPGEGPRRVGSP